MSDYKTVRFDPNYPEKLDEEIIPLCDALNAAGFATTASCCGHGYRWPHVWFEHSSDNRIESMVRAVKQLEQFDFALHFTKFQKEVLVEGYLWSLEIHLNDTYATTPRDVSLSKAIIAINTVAERIKAWAETAGGRKWTRS